MLIRGIGDCDTGKSRALLSAEGPLDGVSSSENPVLPGSSWKRIRRNSIRYIYVKEVSANFKLIRMSGDRFIPQVH